MLSHAKRLLSRMRHKLCVGSWIEAAHQRPTASARAPPSDGPNSEPLEAATCGKTPVAIKLGYLVSIMLG